MGVKEIFQQGMNEFKRQSAVRKEKKNLSQKQSLLSQQLTETGKKAWETKIDIDAFGNSKELISKTQIQIDDLNNQLSKLDSQKQELENTKKEKNDSFNAEHKEIADKKKEVDSVLDNEKKQFKEAQREMSNADNRIKQINKEEEQLTAKAAAPDTPQEEKNAIPQKLETLRSEKNDLQNKWNTASAAVKTTEEKIKPLEEESSKYQAEIDKIKDEQRKTIGELDDTLSKVNKETSDNKTILTDITNDQNKNFEHLGEKIAGAGISNPSIAAELDAANITKKEIETIEVSVQSLEQQGTAASRSAFWKMIGVIAAGVVVVIGLIIVISMLLGGKKEPENPLVSILSRGDKNITPAQVEAMKQIGEKMLEQKAKEESESESSEENAETDEEETKTPATPEEAMKQMTDATGELRKQSEQLAGKKLVASNKEALMAVLPDISGWKQEDTNYNKGSFGQLEYSDLNTTYKNAAGQEVQVRISDTAAASAMLQMYRMAFNMNISHEDGNGYERISTVNSMRVIEKYSKDPSRASFTFIVKSRYLVELNCSGENPVNRLKEFLPNLNLSVLE